MNSLSNIIQVLHGIKLPNNEVLYSFKELKEILDIMPENEIEAEDCIIVPYYFFDGRRMELYEYEFDIRLVEIPDFYKYILKKTGKSRVMDIPENIICQQKNCYYEISKKNKTIPKDRIQQYIQYLYDNEILKKEIQKVFTEFNTEKILFAFY